MSKEKALLVTIDTFNGDAVRRWIKTPSFMIEEGLGFPPLMIRAEREAEGIGSVRSIEISDIPEGKKPIPWKKP